MNNQGDYTPRTWDFIKFVIMSAIGAFLFLTPVRDGESFNIPLGVAISWLGDIFGRVSFGEYALGQFQLHYMLALIAITASLLGTILAYTVKPKFIMERPKVKSLFLSSPIYFASKAVAFLIVWMIFLGVGPDFVINSFTGDVMIGLTASLVTIFIILGPAMPFITEFGLMEFIGVGLRRFVRFLFTLPGRASIDLIASWFGSSAASIIITRSQHEKGFYTDREAAVISTNFSLVSLPFTFVVAGAIGLPMYFAVFYLIVCITCIFLALVMPRLWPLRGLPDTYLADVGKQIEEDVPKGTSTLGYASNLARQKASETTARDVVRSGVNSYLNLFMDLIPVILAWGTLALIVFELTPIFDTISYPMGLFLNLLRVEGAFEFAAATLVGFVDMYIPALIIGGAPVETRFILGILSVVQIIYLAETGVLIIKSKIPLGIGKLFVIFMMRTIIALPIIVGLTRLMFNPS